MPNLEIGAGAWILAGGTHHSSFSYSITTEMMEDYAEIADIEMLIIDKDTNIREFQANIRNNEVYYMLNKALNPRLDDFDPRLGICSVLLAKHGAYHARILGKKV
jgi:hypothetical protein